MIQFKDEVIQIAKSLVETGEIYISEDGSRRNIGLAAMLHATEGGFLSIGKADDDKSSSNSDSKSDKSCDKK